MRENDKKFLIFIINFLFFIIGVAVGMTIMVLIQYFGGSL